MPNLHCQFLSAENFQTAWEKVAKNNGCAGVDGETIADFKQRAEQSLTGLRKAVAEETYRPMPLRHLIVPKAKGGWRNLGVPTVRDRIVQQALLQVLHPVMEVQFEGCSFAYRPERSHLMAVRQVAYWRDRGYEWVLDADIVQYFDNIQHSRLLAEVKERVNQPWLIALVEAWIGAGLLTQDGILLPVQGVPQGGAISPILANIYLDDFDEVLSERDWKLVRYADDFVLMARSRARLEQGKVEVVKLLNSMGLRLHADKTRITNFEQGFRFLGHVFAGDLVVPVQKTIEQPAAPIQKSNLTLVHSDPPAAVTSLQQALVEALKQEEKPIPPPLFVVLGYKVRSETSVVIASDEIIWSAGMSTLYLVQQGATLRKEQERFLVAVKEATTEIPIREVERILVFGNIQLTTAVISTCLELQIPIIFLTQLGEYKGHLGSADTADLILEKAQFQRQQDQAFRVETAREIVQGKLWNSKQLLLRLNRKRQLAEVTEAVEKLAQDIEAVSLVEKTAMLDTIRGHEGAGAARYFAALSRLIRNPGFALTERNFHPPKDPINSLLSFGYTLLFNNVFSLLLAEGLNPYLGNLHGGERPKAYLAFDLMEEFRSPIVDTLVMKLVNQKILQPTDFTYPTAEGGIYLEEPARRVFLSQFEARMSEKVSHPDVQEPVTYRRVIQLQVQRYAKAVLGNKRYETFRRVI
jgi:CRISPR-associated protein Cas1